MLSPWVGLLDGVEVHNNLTHWSMSTQVVNGNKNTSCVAPSAACIDAYSFASSSDDGATQLPFLFSLTTCVGIDP